MHKRNQDPESQLLSVTACLEEISHFGADEGIWKVGGTIKFKSQEFNIEVERWIQNQHLFRMM